jgi:hypothetical protein
MKLNLTNLFVALIVPVLMGGSLADASTFVGNGGNSANLDLALTLAEIRKTNELIFEDPKSTERCTAEDRHQQYAFWAVLDNLTKKQREFCAEFVLKHSKKIASLAAADGSISFVWSPTDIEIKTESGLKKVQAVANFINRTITIDEDKFIELTETKRVALITHELFHFVKVDEKPLGDSGKIGPFKTTGQLLDVAGSAIASWSESDGIIGSYGMLNDLSRAFHSWWITMETISIDLGEDNASKLLTSGNMSGDRFTLRKQFSAIGVYLSQSTLSETVYAGYSDYTLDIEHKSSFTEAGITYRAFVSRNPMSYFGQFHFLFTLGGEFGKHEVSYSDGYTTFSDTAEGKGAKLSVDAMFPLYYGFWINVGYGLRQHSYEFETLDIKIDDSLSTQTTMGLSYAFK